VTSDFSRDLPTPRRALAVGAHPDDVEFGCGGTLAKWAAAGCSIHHLVCTDGSKGSWDADDDRAQLVVARQQEQRAASEALGGNGDVVFLGWPDGELESGLRQRSQVAYWIRVLRPEVVLGHDPWRRYRLHPDHRHAGFLAVEGIVAARDPHFFPEHGATAHRPSTLLLWEADEPDHVEDITDYLDTKLAALMAHRSQFRSTMNIDDPASEDQVAAFRKKITDRASAHGEGVEVRFGEQFKAVREL
jgi:LmbE family N-acetylglucosaminyl deacetylase